jgi:hypothetical protein
MLSSRTAKPWVCMESTTSPYNASSVIRLLPIKESARRFTALNATDIITRNDMVITAAAYSFRFFNRHLPLFAG